MSVTAENRRIRSRTATVALCAPSLTLRELGANRGLRVERWEKNRLSHTAAFIIISSPPLLPLCSVLTIIYVKQTLYTTVHNAAATLQSQFMLHVMLFPILHVLYLYISTFPSLYSAPNMAVFCTSLISCCPVCCSGIL